MSDVLGPFDNVTITNCDDDNLYEVIVYDKSNEKVYQAKVSKVVMELLPSKAYSSKNQVINYPIKPQ